MLQLRETRVVLGFNGADEPDPIVDSVDCRSANMSRALGGATTRAWTLHLCETARPQKKTVTHFFISRMSEQVNTEKDSSVTNLIRIYLKSKGFGVNF